MDLVQTQLQPSEFIESQQQLMFLVQLPQIFDTSTTPHSLIITSQSLYNLNNSWHIPYNSSQSIHNRTTVCRCYTVTNTARTSRITLLKSIITAIRPRTTSTTHIAVPTLSTTVLTSHTTSLRLYTTGICVLVSLERREWVLEALIPNDNTAQGQHAVG